MSQVNEYPLDENNIVCFDNGGVTFDRYTVLFIGDYALTNEGTSLYIGMSEHPFHPQGFGQHGELFGVFEIGISYVVDDFWSSDNGDEIIPFADLPEDCKKAVMIDYNNIWNLGD